VQRRTRTALTVLLLAAVVPTVAAVHTESLQPAAAQFHSSPDQCARIIENHCLACNLARHVSPPLLFAGFAPDLSASAFIHPQESESQPQITDSPHFGRAPPLPAA
jgi:hypothetical protein